jgi:hypothetical protein
MMLRPELEQLRQRVTVNYHLLPLGQDETAEYLNFRLRRAAVGPPLEFPRPVADVIHRHSDGVPRRINVIADAILMHGYGQDRRAIDLDLALDALKELHATGIVDDRPAPSATSARLPQREPEPPVSALRPPAQNAEKRAAPVVVGERPGLPREGRVENANRAFDARAWEIPAAAPPVRAVAPPTAAAASRQSSTLDARQLWPAGSTRIFQDRSERPVNAWVRLWRGLFGMPRPVLGE